MALGALRPCGRPGCSELVREGRCPPHEREHRQRLEATRLSRQRRGYGSRWEASRRGWLRAHPKCVKCGRPANVVDHIVPHKGDWSLFWDFRGNVQSMCTPCHSKKTAMDDGRWGMLSMRPPFPGPLERPLTVVCGPPGAGKTTYVASHAQPGDLVVDLDAIKSELSGLPPYHANHEEWRERAMRERNKRLVGLCFPDCPHPRAWLISSCPLVADRRWWRALGAETVLIRPPIERVLQNISSDARRPPLRAHEHLHAAAEWFKRHSVEATETVLVSAR